MRSEPESLSLDDISRIAKEARRSAGNEASLLWAWGGCVLTFVFMTVWPGPVPWLVGTFGLAYIAACILSGVVLSGIIAAIHYHRQDKRTRHFAEMNNAIMAVERTKRQAQTQAKIAKMKAEGEL